MRSIMGAAAFLGLHTVSAIRDPFAYELDDWPNDPVQRLVFSQPRLATFTSERPLSKRQRRRQRGKAHP